MNLTLSWSEKWFLNISKIKDDENRHDNIAKKIKAKIIFSAVIKINNNIEKKDKKGENCQNIKNNIKRFWEKYYSNIIRYYDVYSYDIDKKHVFNIIVNDFEACL